jgi:hypothetical protein
MNKKLKRNRVLAHSEFSRPLGLGFLGFVEVFF